MSTSISQVDRSNPNNNVVIRDAEFVRLTMAGTNSSVYTFSTSFKQETVDSTLMPNQSFVEENISIPFNGTTATQYHTVFTPMGGLVSISEQQRDLSATSFDTTIALAGVDQTKLNQILTFNAGLKGAKVEIWRGFYNENYVLSGSLVKRYTGIVTGYVLDENYAEFADTYLLSLHCSSFKSVLENRIAGRFTNKSSWNVLNPTDTAMDNVAAIANARYAFGTKLA